MSARAKENVKTLPATTATAPFNQKVKRADAKPKRMLKGRKHQMKRGLIIALEVKLLLGCCVMKSNTINMPGRAVEAAFNATPGRRGGDGTKSATTTAEPMQAAVYLPQLLKTSTSTTEQLLKTNTSTTEQLLKTMRKQRNNTHVMYKTV